MPNRRGHNRLLTVYATVYLLEWAANGSKLGRPLYITAEDVRRAKAWVAALDEPVLDEALNGGKRTGKH